MRFFDRVMRDLGARRHDDAVSPVRPSIPPLLTIGLFAWGACAFLWPSLRIASTETCLVAGSVCCVIACAFLTALMIRRRRIAAFCVVVGVLLGSSFACAGAVRLHADQEALAHHAPENALLEATEDASCSSYGYCCQFIARFSDGCAGKIQAYLDEETPPMFGDLFSAEVETTAVSESSAAWAWSAGQAATATVSDRQAVSRTDAMGMALSTRAQAVEALSGEDEASAVLQALVCGYCATYDETRIKQDFTVCGLAHIVAVSGAHLVIVGAFVSALIRAMRFPRGFGLILQCFLMLGYLVLAGMPVSAVRAFIMALTLQLSFAAGRRGTGLSALGACIIGMIAFDATVAVSASFALSALSTLGIALFSPLLSSWLESAMGFAPRMLRDALAMTLASAVLAQPYSCALFSQLPLVSPLANVLAAPLVGPVCALGIIAGLMAAAFPVAGAFLVELATCCARVLCDVVSWNAQLPFASIPVVIDARLGLGLSAVSACALWWFWPLPRKLPHRRRLLAGLCLVVLVSVSLLAVPLFSRDTRLVMLDVGQGDAFLLRSEGAAVLVDTGAYESLLRSALARQGIRRLDAVIITHSDEDHCGALASLRGVVAVDRVFVAAEALACECSSCAALRDDAAALVGSQNVIGLRCGDAIDAGRFSLQTLWPERYVEEGGNADSLCFLVSCDIDADEESEATTLMVGDAEAEQLEEIVEDHRLGEVDILKVGHHGSAKSFDDELLDRLSPKMALISVGEGNRYGHPAPEIISFLEQQGARIFRTDIQGDVSCRFTDESIEVETLR